MGILKGFFALGLFFCSFFNGSLLLAAGPEELLREQWPAATSIEKDSVLLTGDELARVNREAGVQSKDQVYRVYRVLKDKETLGYGVMASQIVRTKTMAILYMLDPRATIKSIEVLAFWEPPEYEPKETWLESFENKNLQSPLRLKQDITNITGATLSARAVVQKARLARQIVKLKLQKKP